MNAVRPPKWSRARLVLHAYEVAKQAEDHADALQRATGGRLSPRTAGELRALADRLAQLHAARPPRGGRGMREAILEALRVMTTLRNALRTLGDPGVEAQLRELGTPRHRSVARISTVVAAHLALYQPHAEALHLVLGTAFEADLGRVRGTFANYAQRQQNQASSRGDHGREIEAATADLWTLVCEVARCVTLPAVRAESAHES